MSASANNWDNLFNDLGAEAFNSIRHDFGRKLDTFRDATKTVSIASNVYARLDHLAVEDDPFDELPERFVNSIFIAELNGKEYLVNTEGFSYCRYIAKVKIA